MWAYASIPSVREILLVRSTEIAAELLCRQADGSWPDQPELVDGGAEVALAGIGYRAPLREFYEDTHLGR